MVQTIAPWSAGSRKRWRRMVGVHVLGATASATALGAMSGLLGRGLGAPWGATGAAAVGALAVAYLAREAFGVPIPIPDLRRQVPEWWRSHLPRGTAAFLYGAGLGVGFLTHLRHGTFVVVSAAAVASGEPLPGAVATGAFGLARSLTVIAARDAVDQSGVARLTETLDRTAPLTRWLNGATLFAVAGVVALTAPAARAAGPTPVAAILLAVTFAWAAAAKALRPGPWRRALARHRLPGPVEAIALVATPVAELVVPLAVAAGSARIGAGLALVLLAAFSAAVVRARAVVGARVPCGCFGGRQARDWRLLLARNALLAALAAVALRGPASLPRPEPPAGVEVVALALFVAGTALTAVLVRRAVVLLRR